MDGTATKERPLRYTHVTSFLLSLFPFLLAPLPSSCCSFLPDRINVRTVSTKDAPVGTETQGFVDVHLGRRTPSSTITGEPKRRRTVIYEDEDQRTRVNENQLNDERDKLASTCLGVLASMGNLTLLRSSVGLEHLLFQSFDVLRKILT